MVHTNKEALHKNINKMCIGVLSHAYMFTSVLTNHAGTHPNRRIKTPVIYNHKFITKCKVAKVTCLITTAIFLYGILVVGCLV